MGRKEGGPRLGLERNRETYSSSEEGRQGKVYTRKSYKDPTLRVRLK